MQLVTQLVDPDYCESGWTELWSQLRMEGREQIISLQPAYVDTFETLEDFALALRTSYRKVGSEISTTRFSLSWPCYLENAAIREGFLEVLLDAKDAGYAIELALSQHDSYPAALHEHPDFGMLGGWAHPDAPASFIEYTQRVLDEMGPELETGTVIYLAIEPTPQLFDSYLNEDGKYPPGGRGAGRSLAVAMLNQRDAFLEAGRLIRKTGFTPAIAPNVRPLVSKLDAPGAWLLNELHNWWLTDALVLGCIDNDFDGQCEDTEASAVDHLGITFYGVMGAREETVEFGLPGKKTQPLARRWFGFAPNSDIFRYALTTTRARYEERIKDGSLEFDVAEIGFSSGNTDTQLGWMGDYLGEMRDLEIPSVGIHALFKHAEFSSGEWYFRLLIRCFNGACDCADWGIDLLNAIQEWNDQ